jgi:hypothetical protein
MSDTSRLTAAAETDRRDVIIRGLDPEAKRSAEDLRALAASFQGVAQMPEEPHGGS